VQQAKTALMLALEPEGVQRVVNDLTIAPYAPPAPVPPRAPVPVAIPVKQASVTETAPDTRPADEEATQPTEQPQQQEQKGNVTRVPSQPPKPMFAFLDTFRRPSETDRTPQPAEVQADGQATQPQPQDQGEIAIRASSRPSDTYYATRPTAKPADDGQFGARRVPASFTPAPVQRAAAAEPEITEPAPQPMPQRETVAPRPIRVAMLQPAAGPSAGVPGGPLPMATPGMGGAVAPTRFDVPNMPNHAWPSYASYPNYAAVTYPRQYSATAWPYIGPFYPYPQVPLGWRKVTLQWDDGWWMLDFKDEPGCCWWR
jgi:hypothetical protein